MRKIILVLLISITNFWIWRIFVQSAGMAIILVLLSIFLVLRLKWLSLIFFILLSIFLLKTSFDTNLLYVSPLENDKLENRHEYYAQSLGRLYRNRIGIYLHKNISPYVSRFEKNLAYNLDPNLYFFASHPRERLGIDEFNKFPLIALPFFLIGLGVLLSGRHYFLIGYFVLSIIVSGFIFPGYRLGPILIFPFMISILYLGLLKVINRFS
ncbi:hypothetical protein A2210_00455 [Candidatus Woesebacteria bacterium RIFOXYA1_FULL_40_18]|uniref:Uncharacterized protein n=2 Tax=Candidatus Woeseibacteriota TaxID=1752722 RepID=A0A0G0UTJ1_9BACT|nr:MAG: hypothetical protein UU03_C0018G0004 [Candidatus Woesebacteria bacterium GW2011_GWA1_40_45]OGM77001.1 MAG: hypothetical protein A2210_00455 [Candidatus Woesebacteria bacterium RIFOXYA1_FULL_40_18]